MSTANLILSLLLICVSLIANNKGGCTTVLLGRLADVQKNSKKYCNFRQLYGLSGILNIASKFEATLGTVHR